MARAAVLNQEYFLQFRMLRAKEFQFMDVVLMVIRLQEYQFHEASVNYQEHQHILGAMPLVIKFLLLDRTRDRAADRLTFQYLEVRDLINAHDPDALFRQPSRISIAPQHLLRSLFEPRIQPSCFPVAGAMGLQTDIVQDVPYRACADTRNNPIGHSLR